MPARMAVTRLRTRPTEVPRILPAMQQQQEARPRPRPRARSAFTAAFLSLIFPGLGHAYARAWYRAVAFAAAPFLLLALLAGAMISYNIEILGVALQPPVLIAILVGNVVAYGYRIVAAVDAYRVVRYLNRVSEGGAGRLGPARATLAPISVAGLLSVILVMGGAHAAVAYYDLQALTAVQNIFNPTDTGAGDRGVGVTGFVDRPRRLGHPVAVGDGRDGRRDRGAIARPLERDRAPQRPAHRDRQAAERGDLEHRHADRGEHRSRLPPGGDVQPPARHRGRPAPADPGPRRRSGRPTT